MSDQIDLIPENRIQKLLDKAERGDPLTDREEQELLDYIISERAPNELPTDLKPQEGKKLIEELLQNPPSEDDTMLHFMYGDNPYEG